MNYRHAFHAGNFADVFKHALLTRLLLYLGRKDAPFRIIDTHAGEGAYDLSSDEAERTGEWRQGIGRLADVSQAPSETIALLEPYLDCVGPFVDGRPSLYPGSPLISQKFMRAIDRAIFCELRPDGFDALSRRFSRDKRIKTIYLDGYTGAGAFAPPVERRGLMLIDPPFERTDEFQALLDAFLTAWRKWPTGIYALWYPVKEASLVGAFRKALERSGVRRVLRLELCVGGSAERLNRTGLIVVNPPYVFEEEARQILGFLAERLAQGQGAEFVIETLAGE
jgi:23S rRNA (adenine2030-N6)-methyltransferase